MFKCPYCSQQFSFESSRQVHVNRHHAGQASAAVDTSSLMADDDSTGFVSSFLSSEATQTSLDFSVGDSSTPSPDPSRAPDFGGGSSDGGGASSNW